MSAELYFLRSSEQKIVLDMFALAHPKKVEDKALVEKYTAFYGLTRKDLGLYAMIDQRVAGAIWARKFQDDSFATLSIAVVERFKAEGIEELMMEQFLLEAASQFEEIGVEIKENKQLENLFASYDFTQKEKNFWHKKLEKKEIIRPSDGYDYSKWLD